MKHSPLLEIQNLTVRYHGGHEAVTVEKGERVGIVGESGSGKSSIARAILGLAPHVSEKLQMLGQEFQGTDRTSRIARARSVQMIFQDPYHSLSPRRTIRQTLIEALRASGTKAIPSAIDKQAADLLRRVHLDPDATLSRYPHQFSGGQRQRIAIARALAPNPQLLICDEAVSALDITTQVAITHLLKDLSETNPIALLFITHDLPLIEDLCEKTIVIHQGRLVEQGPTKQIFTAPSHPQTQRLLDSVIRLAR